MTPTGYTDGPELVQALRRGDEGAFVWLLDQYDPMLRRIARGYVRADVLPDVLQETWIAVLRGIAGFQERSSLRTWIVSILINVARSHGAREARIRSFVSLAGVADGPGDAPAFGPGHFQGPGGDEPGTGSRVPRAGSPTPSRGPSPMRHAR